MNDNYENTVKAIIDEITKPADELRKKQQIEAHRDDRAALQALTNWIVRGNG